MYGIDHIGMGIGGLGMLLVWLLPFVLIFLVLRHFFENRQERRDKSALGILEQRYAQGEIDRVTYLKQRADLEGRGRPAQGG